MTLPLAEAAKLAKLIEESKKYRRLDFFTWYAPQQEFFRQGVAMRERCFMAGNRVGKSEAGAREMALHLTGDYPPDWEGKRFSGPIKAWVAGKTSIDVRDVPQSKLCGQYGVESAFGTGMISLDRFVDKPTLSRGVTDAYDTIQVKHRTNGVEDGISICQFKSYERGRAQFQGEQIDVGWCDEEPPMDIYSEFLTRLSPDGIMFATLTPMYGQTALCDRFMIENRPDCGLVNMALEDAKHFTPEQIAQRIAAMPAHERDARSKGLPMQGSGKVFQFPESDIVHDRDPASFPRYWPWLNAIDFQHASGSEAAHPFAWVSAAIDPDADMIWLMYALRMRGTFPINHAAAVKRFPSFDARTAWPHDGATKDFSSGKTFAATYKELGLNMLPSHATFKDGGYDFEAGIDAMQQRFARGGLRVHRSLVEWFEEYRFLHREDLKVVKVKDDLLSATRVLCMSTRFARPLSESRPGQFIRANNNQVLIAEGTDFDPFDLSAL